MQHTFEAAVEVNCPVSACYDQFTQFEEFPRFMADLRRVSQLDEKTTQWVAQMGAVRPRQWTAEIFEQIPDEKISWRSVRGVRNAGTVMFEPLGPQRTRVAMRLAYDLEGLVDRLGQALGVIESHVHGDLRAFKDFLESRQGAPTGAWRGEIHKAEIVPPARRPRRGRDLRPARRADVGRGRPTRF